MNRLAAAALLVLALSSCAGPSAGPTYAVVGQALAGPTCPVEPPSPVPGQCDPRLVAGAVLIVTDASGREVARLTSGADGRFATRLPIGSYTLTPQPVSGLIGGSPPIAFEVVAADQPVTLRVEYDTGIR